MPKPLMKSPLLDDDSGESTHSRSPFSSSGSAGGMIRPDKLDQNRFTEMRGTESEGSSFRIILYVVIVIVIGVGAALLIRNLITTNTNTPTPQVEQTTNNVPEVTALTISTNPLSDTSAINLADNNEYKDSALITLGDSKVDITKAKLDKITYTRFTTFARMIFDLSTLENKLPKSNISYDSIKNRITIEFVGLSNVNDDLKTQTAINDIVKSISFESASGQFVIELSEKSKYRVFTANDNLNIDIKTVKQLETPDTTTQVAEVTPEVTPEVVNPVNVDPSKPTAPHYDNTFGQTKQYVSSAITDNSIAQNQFYYWDQGTFFEFSWGAKDKVGDSYVPNATAYYDTAATNGKIYIIVELSNLSQEAFSIYGITGTDLSGKVVTSASNFVRADLTSFDKATGVAKYKIEVKKKTDFKLLTQKTYDGKAQILSLQMKD